MENGRSKKVDQVEAEKKKKLKIENESGGKKSFPGKSESLALLTSLRRRLLTLLRSGDLILKIISLEEKNEEELKFICRPEIWF